MSLNSLSSVIARVSVVLKRTVGDSELRFDNLSGSHLQSQSDTVSSVDGNKRVSGKVITPPPPPLH